MQNVDMITGGFVLCIRGTRRIAVNGHFYTVCPEQAYILSPALLLHVLDSSPDFECVKLERHISTLFPVLRHLMPYLVQRGILESPVFHVPPEVAAPLQAGSREMQCLERELAATDEEEERAVLLQMQNLQAQRMILVLARHLLKAMPRQPHRMPAAHNLVLNFIFALLNNFARHRDVAWYAGEAHLSVGYFSSIVRNTLGRTPSELIALCTIQNAKCLLDDTGLSVKEVSHRLGFPEQFTFRKYFKSHTGLSPTDYRRSLGDHAVTSSAPRPAE